MLSLLMPKCVEMFPQVSFGINKKSKEQTCGIDDVYVIRLAVVSFYNLLSWSWRRRKQEASKDADCDEISLISVVVCDASSSALMVEEKRPKTEVAAVGRQTREVCPVCLNFWQWCEMEGIGGAGRRDVVGVLSHPLRPMSMGVDAEQMRDCIDGEEGGD
ncbi:hypothetical protein GW17_00011775 [Ensete ventricosum]|nr:hypothetical protein GW17_00011775 [Ensete ventricosum]